MFGKNIFLKLLDVHLAKIVHNSVGAVACLVLAFTFSWQVKELLVGKLIIVRWAFSALESS